MPGTNAGGLTNTATGCLVCQESGSKMVLQQAFQIADQKKVNYSMPVSLRSMTYLS